jgi:preprotein translocase subunit SecG
MENLQNFLLIVHIIIAFFIVILVLLQPSGNGDGLVSSYSNLGNVVSSRATANFLSKTTMFLAIVFMCNTLFLGMIAHKKSKINSIVEKMVEEKKGNKVHIPLAE